MAQSLLLQEQELPEDPGERGQASVRGGSTNQHCLHHPGGGAGKGGGVYGFLLSGE